TQVQAAASRLDPGSAGKRPDRGAAGKRPAGAGAAPGAERHPAKAPATIEDLMRKFNRRQR
ncbi:MAG: hypothetical protein JOZ15_05905, partial [Acidobacteria bacterium]|nr:hypothetical protein [Acidobacteriota bacterium]